MIFWDDGTYRQEVFDMWQRNFHDPVSYAEFYFREVYGKNEVLLNAKNVERHECAARQTERNFMGTESDRRTGEGFAEKKRPFPEEKRSVEAESGGAAREVQEIKAEDVAFSDEKNTLRGMLHLNPYALRIKKQPEDAAYIVGVATDEQYRRQGVMRELLREAFLSLRERGQCLTYLMPADEQYYLPFDFRFGMAQVEQEMEYLPEMAENHHGNLDGDERNSAGSLTETVQTKSTDGTAIKKTTKISQVGELTQDANYLLLTELSDSQLSQAAEIENQEKDALFDIYTEITPAYLKRLEKEVTSDYGQVFYVFKNGNYEGRFAAETENDYLILSQIFCAQKESREEFLRQAIYFCAKKYHFQRFQIIADPSWRDVLTDAGRSGNLRRMPAKRVKKIMFRILDVKRLAGFLESRKDVSGDIYIEDTQIGGQDGRYHFSLNGGKVKITKTREESDRNAGCSSGKNGAVATHSAKPGFGSADGCGEKTDGGKITIGSLTEYLFSPRISDGEKSGRKEASPQESLRLPDTLTETGKEILQGILPLSEICIMEIV